MSSQEKKRNNVPMVVGCLVNLNKCEPLSLSDYRCWGEVSFVQGLCLIAKEMKYGVKIILYISYNQCYNIIAVNRFAQNIP